MTGGSVDVRVTRLADAGSVLGQLQRGRGEGFLDALEMPGAQAADLVWECIVHDPRYDLQIDSRDLYYATLAQEVGLEVERLRPQNCPPHAPDVDQRLVVGVLAELVAVGVDGADAVLLDHVAHGDQWDDAIYEISQSPGDLYRQLPAVLDARFPEDECVAIVHRLRYEVPWGRIDNLQPWVKRAIDSFDDRAASNAYERPEPPAMDRPIADLLDYPWSRTPPKRLLHRLTAMLRGGEREALVAALETSGTGQWVAFQALARLDDPGGMGAAETILRVDASGPERAAALRYLQNLSGDHTLGLARSWINEPDGRGVAARGIFERHAESSDEPLLVSGLAEAWEARDFYALCSFIDALARLSDRKPIEQIVAIFEQAEYSYARCRAARALIAIDKEVFIERYARAALWDCEGEIQERAAGLVVGRVDELAASQIREVESRRVKSRSSVRPAGAAAVSTDTGIDF